MKKASIIKLLTYLLILGAFNVILYFVTEFDFSLSSWIAYGAIHFSFFIMLCGIMAEPSKKRDISAVLARRTISGIYGALVFVAGIIFFYLDTDNIVPVLITQIVLFVGFCVFSSSQRSAESTTSAVRASLNADKRYIDEATSRLHAASQKAIAADVLKKIELAYDIIHSSPIQSSDNAKIVEQRIINCISELERAISNGDEQETKTIVERIIADANERNYLLK